MYTIDDDVWVCLEMGYAIPFFLAAGLTTGFRAALFSDKPPRRIDWGETRSLGRPIFLLGKKWKNHHGFPADLPTKVNPV